MVRIRYVAQLLLVICNDFEASLRVRIWYVARFFLVISKPH